MLEIKIDQPSRPRHKRIVLAPHSFVSENLLEIEAVARRYIHCRLSRHDPFTGTQLPMCQTTDGIPVYFVGSIYHLLSKDTRQPLRSFDPTRVERVHWLIPIIEGRVKSTVHLAIGCGEELGRSFREGMKYRVYWVSSHKYQIILQYRSKNTRLTLITAYRVTEPSSRKFLDALFGT